MHSWAHCSRKSQSWQPRGAFPSSVRNCNAALPVSRARSRSRCDRRWPSEDTKVTGVQFDLTNHPQLHDVAFAGTATDTFIRKFSCGKHSRSGMWQDRIPLCARCVTRHATYRITRPCNVQWRKAWTKNALMFCGPLSQPRLTPIFGAR